MTDAPDDPAQRYLALWTQYLTALLAEPQAMETLKRWMALTGQFAYPAQGAAQSGAAPPAGAPFPAWPPFFGPFGFPAAPAAAPAPDAVAALARRVDELEARLAALEGTRKPRPAPRRARR